MTLTVENLAVSLGGARLFAPLSFELSAGDRLALVGPSGIGKSTALRAIADLIPFEGEVQLSPSADTRATFRRDVVYVSQSATMWSGSIEENLARPFTFASATHPFDRGNALAELAGLGLELELSREATSLSGGEQQRVQLARALLLKPRFLLLDEPSSALDPESAERVSDRVCAFEGGVVLVSHDERWRDRVVSRVLLLERL